MVGYVPWDVRISLDLFLGGLGIGIFLVSVLLSFYDRERYGQLIKKGAYLAPVLLGAGILLLLSELGRPERFLTTMFRVNPSSVTSWGGFLQAIFGILSLAYAGMLFKNQVSGTLFQAVKGIGVVFAIAVGIYHGLLLASLGRPLWVGGMVAVLFLTSSLLGGTGLLLLLKAFTAPLAVSQQARTQTAAAQEGNSKTFSFTLLFFGLAAANLIFTIIWQISLSRSAQDTVEAMNSLLSDYGFLWWGGFIIAGLLVPMLGSLYQLLKNRNAEMSNQATVILSALTILGSFIFKHIVLAAGQVPVNFF